MDIHITKGKGRQKLWKKKMKKWKKHLKMWKNY